MNNRCSPILFYPFGDALLEESWNALAVRDLSQNIEKDVLLQCKSSVIKMQLHCF